MKLRINRDHLANGLAQVLSVVSAKATMPILGNVLIVTAKDSVVLTTTNLDLGIRCAIKAEIEKAGAVTLPVRRLASIVRELPALDVSLESSVNHQVKITSGGSIFRIMGIGKDDFPALPASPEKGSAFTMKQSDLASMLGSVSYAQSSDSTRYILNGVYLLFKGGSLSTVATDGRRLAVASTVVESAAASAAAIVPAKTISDVMRLLGTGEQVKIKFDDRRITFDFDVADDSTGLAAPIFLYSKVVEGNYPNYSQVIPKERGQQVKIAREDFLACVHRAALVCSEKSNSVRLRVAENTLEVRAQSPDFGEAHESVAIAYSGPEIQIAFNPEFVMDPLRALKKDEVTFELRDEASPGVIRAGDDFICVIMPVRLS